ncbi:MAG TPA: glycerophosphodiester phosphodiesterase, partial [Rhodobacteraceae bacterium]|nr:glycerophosphodiester phosphodiesterase [Paracoccaceae bacterium]
MSISSQSFLEYINNINIVPIAHRGASLLASENSFASFRTALDLGYRVIETDIHSSKDGTAYIFHDNTLERLTGENLKISNLKDVDIDSLKVNQSSIIPRLSNVFEEFPEALFNLDAKTWEATIPVA